MEYASQHQAPPHVSHTFAIGSISGGFIGAGAMALAILGLVGIFPPLLLTIGVIAAGAAFLIEGSAVSGRYSKLMAEAGGIGSGADVTSGMNSYIFGGIIGVTLGVLSLIGVAPELLIPISVIAFGATLITESRSTSRVATLIYSPTERVGRIAQEAANSAVTVDVLVGVGTIALGILALIGTVPLTLNLVAVLAVGAALFFNGSSVGARIAGAFNR